MKVEKKTIIWSAISVVIFIVIGIILWTVFKTKEPKLSKETQQLKGFTASVLASANKYNSSDYSSDTMKKELIETVTLAQVKYKSDSVGVSTLNIMEEINNLTGTSEEILNKTKEFLKNFDVKGIATKIEGKSSRPTKVLTLRSNTVCDTEAIDDKYCLDGNNSKLSANVYVHDEESTKWVVLLHPFMTNGSIMYGAFGNEYKELGYNVLALDLRGFGNSSGKVAMGYLESLDTYDWLLDLHYNYEKRYGVNNQPDTIIIHGMSLGAATTLQLATNPDIAASEDNLTKLGVKVFYDDGGYTSMSGLIEDILTNKDMGSLAVILSSLGVDFEEFMKELQNTLNSLGITGLDEFNMDDISSMEEFFNEVTDFVNYIKTADIKGVSDLPEDIKEKLKKYLPEDIYNNAFNSNLVAEGNKAITNTYGAFNFGSFLNSSVGTTVTNTVNTGLNSTNYSKYSNSFSSGRTVASGTKVVVATNENDKTVSSNNAETVAKNVGEDVYIENVSSTPSTLYDSGSSSSSSAAKTATAAAGSSNTYSKKQMRDFVVSTALSYLHNNRFSDYDQLSMDNSTGLTHASINWRNLRVSPEEVNRTNFFSIDCSSFVTITYLYSLGYDFTEYSDVISKIDTKPKPIYRYKYNNGSIESKQINKTNNNSTETHASDLINGYLDLGLSMKVKFFIDIAINELVKNNKIEAGKVYTDKSNSSIGVLFYKNDGDKSKNDMQNLYTKYFSGENHILEPGDIILYRNKNGSGHTLIYAGTYFNKDTRGVIHATGNDYKVDEFDVNGNMLIGDDHHAIRFDPMITLKNNITENKEYVAIIRPINKFCNGDTCTLEQNKSITESMEQSFLNKSARVDLKWLKTEQFARTQNTQIIDLNSEAKVNNWSTSSYNSVNNGENIQYNLYLQNNSAPSFCNANKGGKYINQSDCEEVRNWDEEKKICVGPNGKTYKKYNNKENCEKEKLKWFDNTNSGVTYKDLIIKAEIPENTSFVKDSCNPKCTRSGNIITWNLSSLAKNENQTFSYSVTVNDKATQITNNGMKIQKGDSILQMGKIVTKVNSTITKTGANKIRQSINEFKTAVSNKKIKYGTENTTTYKVDPKKASNSILTTYGFVKNVYYNSFGIDLSELDLNGTNIKNAIFNFAQTNHYFKKTEAEINKLKKDTANSRINKMLVKGFYGGRYLRGNDNKDRPGRLRITDLEVGDIIIYYSTSDNKVANIGTAALYLGTGVNSGAKYADNTENSAFIMFTNNGITTYNMNSKKSAYQFFNELWSKDLFVVLRPSQLHNIK